MAKPKTVFYCTACGNETPKWQGRCPACGAWNTLEEHVEKPAAVGRAKSAPVGLSRKPQKLSQVSSDSEIRFSTGVGELNRVLGGGAVAGSLVLVGGAPGIGKSTLLLQICDCLCAERKVLYISGEESEQQIKLRANRLHVSSDQLYILSETRLSDVVSAVDEIKPDILIIDSIQTLYNEENDSSPGSVSQVKDCTMAMMQLSKGSGITVFVVGHINKDGAIAGPKVLEHMVDCVLYFEGDPNTTYRLLRAAKNRFGSTNEIGVFEMGDSGLIEVPNPSQMLLSGRPENSPGTCVACVMEGTRPILAEVQGLVMRTAYGTPRRMSTGFDNNRVALLLAVLEKRAGFAFSGGDTYVNVVGGLRLDEPAADLPVALSLVSSLRDLPVNEGVVAFGEVGLAGELRSVTNAEGRVREAARLGMTKCILPKQCLRSLNKIADPGIQLIGVKTVKEAVEALGG